MTAPAAAGSRLAPVALVATAILWGSNHVAARAIHDHLPLPSLVFWRWGLALLVLTPIALPTLIAEWPLIRPRLPRLGLLGGVGVGLFSVFLYAGAYHSLALEVGLLNATTPVWVLLIAPLMGGALASRRQMAGIGLALAGTLAILLKGDLANLAALDFRIGNLWALIGAALFAWFTVALGARPLKLSALTVTTLTAWAGLILVALPLYVGFLASGGTDPLLALPPPPAAWSVAYIALGPTLVGNLFWIYGASQIGAARAGPFLYLSPLASLALAVAVLGEPLAAFQFAGAAAILIGLVMANRPRR
ncbi:DMT family transporter [Aquabacter spiritensis]|uniref:EamA-like transporter family protein n=1 Tax=Aquabacter spiritensis TaxID=933073 RepID=A0A4R3LZB9_9HYPH|nr:DMT family transporter [Aquabacter spiritensis]TCT06094.1 EamA-like transporter family protein [Aquabacter spiritensis]